MIHRLAGLQDKNDQEASFEKGTYKWTLARGCSYAFTHCRGQGMVQKCKREEKCDEIHREAHE